MKKEGIISSQIFIYVLAIIIFSALLLFGYKAINEQRNKEEKIVLVQFQTRLSNDIKAYSGDYGSVKKDTYSLPSAYNELCFVDVKNADPQDIINYPVIKDSVESEAKSNIFLIRDDGFEKFYTDDLTLKGYPFACVSLEKENVELEVEGKGDAAAVRSINKKYCKNAQDSDICPALDSLFGGGYKSGCCQKYSLCC